MRVLQALPITAVIGSGPVTLLAAGAFALGLIVLALGIRKQGSIVGRHRAGMIALFVLAGLEVIQGIIIESFTAVPAGSRDAVAAFSDLLIVVALGASVVAAIVIVRAGAVRGILRWLPMIALVIAIALQLAIRIALSEAWNVPLTRGSFVVSAQVALALAESGRTPDVAHSRSGSKTLPGLRMPFGSKTRAICRCSSHCASPSSSRSQRRLSVPMPCSPVSVPPSRSAA